jgi:TolB protein
MWVRAGASPGHRVEGRGEVPVVVGEPIDLSTLTGRIVFDDYEDVFSMRPDGTDLRALTSLPGAEFDGNLSPDGRLVAYRDSRRGINEDDEIFLVGADGSDPRNLTVHPANDWGPEWSPDGRWIAFNSDRDGGRLRGYLMDVDTGELRPIATTIWFEYPSFSPDGRKVAFESHANGDYDIHVLELETGQTTQLTTTRGSDGWASWSPDGTTIAFATERDDCLYAVADADCWRTGQPGDHHSIWLMDADGTNQRRVTPEHGQFVTWSPDSQHLLISGHALFVVRPDGSGRTEIRPEGWTLPAGGLPDWGP